MGSERSMSAFPTMLSRGFGFWMLLGQFLYCVVSGRWPQVQQLSRRLGCPASHHRGALKPSRTSSAQRTDTLGTADVPYWVRRRPLWRLALVPAQGSNDLTILGQRARGAPRRRSNGEDLGELPGPWGQTPSGPLNPEQHPGILDRVCLLRPWSCHLPGLLPEPSLSRQAGVGRPRYRLDSRTAADTMAGWC